MKRNARQIVSVLLVICICMAMLPQALPVANAVSPTYTPSSAYQASSYYSALLDVELTGNQREDIINVALSQVGYAEGSYSGDTGGADDGSYNNYTEYNYWYNNYVNSGMPVGGSYAPWCATFVSWCARQANIPTSILNNSTVAGHASHSFNIKFYSGSSTLASSSDNDSYFMGYNYTPKKGDLFYTRSWSHVGLVVGVSGSYVITVEGNTNDGGSAEGLGVFRRTSRKITDLYFGVPDYVEDYAGSSCTYYPAHCQITIDSDTPINTQPCSVSTEANSVNLGTAAAGQTYTATGLYLNGYGNYWYRVETDYGETSYLYAGDTTYVRQITSDITLTDYDVPSAHTNGSTFSVTGTIASEYNRLDTVACYIYSGFAQSDEAVTGYSDSVSGSEYVLKNSNVDYNTAFGTLESGNYTYEISTTYTNYYATSNTTISSNTGTIRLLNEYFVVIPSSADQSSCIHSYTTTTIGAATCTESGTQIKSCSTCGLVTETVISAGGHSYGSWTTVSAATCTTDGSKTRSCSACGNVETQTVAAAGHDYAMVTHAATCKEYAIYEFTCGSCGDNYKLSADELASGWIDYLPEGMDESLFNTQTQYRYSDYETTTSYETSLSGYTQIGSEWIQSSTGSVKYVPSWPSGFSTSSSIYTQYNKASSKVTASQTETDKTVVGSDTQCGYLYYHWCYTDSYYSSASSSGSYTTFHAYYDTTDPSSYTCDTSDMSYKTSHSTCSNSEWFFVTEVYEQSYTKYQKQFTYERWTDFSDWSTTAVTASDTRKVETRTVFQLKDASLGAHNYVGGTCTVCGAADPVVLPTLSPKYPTLSFEDEVFINVYFTAADLGDRTAADMGLLTWSTARTAGTVDDAEANIPGAVYSSASGMYQVRTEGIPAKNLGDTVYFKIYVKLSDGSYLYTSLLSYSPKSYATNCLSSSAVSTELKALAVAMLNYGTEAQKYFTYKPYDLMNSSLTAEQKALVSSYSSSMVAAVGTVNSSKVGIFTNSGGFSRKYPTISFEGAFSINYYFVPSNTPSGNVRMYYWNAADYNAATTLAPGNATGYIDMTAVDGVYQATVEDIAAKDLDGTIYVAAGYSNDGVSYCTGVLPYSIGSYCVTQAATTGTMQAFAQATAVYGYYAKVFFTE